MTDPLKLADEIEAMVTYSDRTGQCAIGGMHLVAHEGRLLAAALRLAEATNGFEQTSALFPDIDAASTPPDYRPWLRALDAYRKAREQAQSSTPLP